MKSSQLSQLILNDHARIESAIATGAAWEIWFQVEFLILLLRQPHMSAAREAPYPPPNEKLRLDVLARQGVDEYAIELKVESATNAGKKLLEEIEKDILKLKKYTNQTVEARWVVGLGYSDEGKRALVEYARTHDTTTIYQHAGAIGCMIVTVPEESLGSSPMLID